MTTRPRLTGAEIQAVADQVGCDVRTVVRWMAGHQLKMANRRAPSLERKIERAVRKIVEKDPGL